MAIGTLVLVVIVWYGHRSGFLSLGSLIFGLLIGLAISVSPAAQAVGKGVRQSASAIGTGVQDAATASFNAIVKDS